MDTIPKNLQPIYKRLNPHTRGLIDILVRAIERFIQNRGPKAAAGTSYYTIFSIFPLLIFVVNATSYFIDPAKVLQLVTELTKQSPIPMETIFQQVERLNQSRDLFGLIGLVGFLWAASGVFDTLTLNLDLAWGKAEGRSFITRRLVAIGMVVGVVGVVVIIVVYSTLLDMASSQGFTILKILTGFQLPALFHLIPSFLTRLALVWLTYRLVPAAKVGGWPAFWSALLVSAAWGIATAGFSLYLSSGFARYNIIYGSLGVVIAFLTWIYLSAWILLIGAYLAEAIQYHQGITKL